MSTYIDYCKWFMLIDASCHFKAPHNIHEGHDTLVGAHRARYAQFIRTIFKRQRFLDDFGESFIHNPATKTIISNKF